ncbi:MAG: YchJ family metal-binding protein [bacterium]
MIRFGWPKSPKALLEARYKAFVDSDIDFIIASCHPEIRDKQNREEIEKWSRSAKWRGLEIQEHREEGGTGFVTFTCSYEENGQDVEHKEIAEFRKADDQKWYYYDSRKPATTVRREAPKIGRNDPCPCGSGKKYKKCCGK